MNILEKFLRFEIYKDMYEEIIHFINSYEIRNGEFECNEFIIRKIDRENFIIYPEYDDGKGGIMIPHSMAIYKNNLLDEINNYARSKGIID